MLVDPQRGTGLLPPGRETHSMVPEMPSCNPPVLLQSLSRLRRQTRTLATQRTTKVQHQSKTPHCRKQQQNPDRPPQNDDLHPRMPADRPKRTHHPANQSKAPTAGNEDEASSAWPVNSSTHPPTNQCATRPPEHQHPKQPVSEPAQATRTHTHTHSCFHTPRMRLCDLCLRRRPARSFPLLPDRIYYNPNRITRRSLPLRPSTTTRDGCFWPGRWPGSPGGRTCDGLPKLAALPTNQFRSLAR